jgi:hypothetical protein
MAQSVADRSTLGSTVSHTVVTAVAELTDSEPIELEPLFTAVDSDALERLFDTDGGMGRRSPTTVEFAYAGCDVVVSGDGTVSASSAGREVSKRWT